MCVYTFFFFLWGCVFCFGVLGMGVVIPFDLSPHHLCPPVLLRVSRLLVFFYSVALRVLVFASCLRCCSSIRGTNFMDANPLPSHNKTNNARPHKNKDAKPPPQKKPTSTSPFSFPTTFPFTVLGMGYLACGCAVMYLTASSMERILSASLSGISSANSSSIAITTWHATVGDRSRWKKLERHE